MDAALLMKQLEEEGYKEVRVCPIPPNNDLPEHTHDIHTVHIILDGELTIVDGESIRTFKPGDRVEFPAGTVHRARGGTGIGTMIVGVKE